MNPFLHLGPRFGFARAITAGLLSLIQFVAHGANTPNQEELPAPQRKLCFDQPAGFYESPFRLTLSTPVEGATIYYTTNGDAPRPATGLRFEERLPISTTTILRAAAFREDTAVTDVATRTYLFAAAVLDQDGDSLPKVWGTNSGQPLPAHYQMSQTSTNDPAARKKVVEGLRSLPTVSIVAAPAYLFSAARGIYLHPTERGADWERPASVEMFGARDLGAFQINCGLRIHGGMSRRPEESPKHSLRLVFKRRYGAAKLNVPLFGNERNPQFDELVLRAGGSDSWLDSNGERRRQATYVRDELMRQSLRAMGYPSVRGRFVHVFLNGLYWGVYNLCERPGSSLIATDQPQTTTDYDIRNASQTESGDRVVWDKMLNLANSGLDDASRYQAIGQYLDLTQFADYLILNFFAGNLDWDRSANWYAIRPRTPDGRFQFLIWDAEQSMGSVEANLLDLDDDESPMRLFHQLCENAAFRELFAGRARRLLFDGGLLSPEPTKERFRRLADTIAPALEAEAARWGSYRADVHQYKSGPYETITVRDHWQSEIDRIQSAYIPRRREILVDQLREHGLFPAQPTAGLK